MDNLCRACLSTTDTVAELLDMNIKFIENYNLLTNLSIALGDGMPQKSCQLCWDTINKFLTFREKCIKSELSLRETILNENGKNISELSFKQESDEIGQLNEQLVDSLIKLEDIKEEITNVNCMDDCFEDNHFEEDNKDLDWLLPGYRKKSTKLKRLKTKETQKPKPTSKSNEKKTLSLVIKKLKDKSSKEDSKETPCGLCKENFENSTLLLKHLEDHRSDTSCQYCLEPLLDWTQILAHRLCHIPINKQRCLQCQKAFRSNLYLEYHIRTLHSDQEYKGLQCKYCQKFYKTPLRLKKHINLNHRGKQFICNICSKVMTTKQLLQSHLRMHSSEKKYVCVTCGFSCKYPGTLKDHELRRHADFKLTCKSCTRIFAKQDLYDNHIKVCHIQIMCSTCGIYMKNRKSLNRHQLTHSDERPFACQRCPARYRSSNALREHNNRHDGNKTKHCEFCNAKFYSASVLIKHRRIHTGEKPYVCKRCGKGFTGRNNLKVHMKVHGEMLIKKKCDEVEVVLE